MVQPIARIVFPDSESDLYLTQAVARLSSSPAARDTELINLLGQRDRGGLAPDRAGQVVAGLPEH